MIWEICLFGYLKRVDGLVERVGRKVRCCVFYFGRKVFNWEGMC